MDRPAVAAAKQLIEAAVLADKATIDEIGGTTRFTAAGEQAAREVLASASRTDVLWAAIWVYASSGTDPSPLRPYIESSDPSIRAMSAASAMALGDPFGFTALAHSLVDEDQLLGSDPPLSIRSYTLASLTRYVTAEGTPSPPEADEEVARAASDWSDWLARHQGDLRFDRSDGTWKLP